MGFDPAKLDAFLKRSSSRHNKVQTGGKGSVRRKRKVVRHNSSGDMKKMKGILNKLNIRDIPAIEEVNLFKANNDVIHFKSPKVQASITANTYVVSGSCETKKLQDLLPGIISQLGPESIDHLKEIYASFADGAGAKADDDDDDDMPDLVGNFEDASKDEVKLDHIVNVTVPEEAKPQGNEEYISYDDDCILGKKFPDLASAVYVTDENVRRPVDGKPFMIILWAQFHKPGFPHLASYSNLVPKFGDNLPFLALSCDPDIGSPKKYLADPAGKYSKVFPLTFAVAHDDGGKIKKECAALLTEPCSLPHMFLVDASGTIVWHQDHSQIGATAHNHMDMVESQAARLATGAPLQKNGPRPKPESEEEEEDEDDNAGAIDADFVCADDDEAGGASNY